MKNLLKDHLERRKKWYEEKQKEAPRIMLGRKVVPASICDIMIQDIEYIAKLYEQELSDRELKEVLENGS